MRAVYLCLVGLFVTTNAVNLQQPAHRDETTDNYTAGDATASDCPTNNTEIPIETAIEKLKAHRDESEDALDVMNSVLNQHQTSEAEIEQLTGQVQEC